MYYIVVKHDGHRVLSQCNTRLRILYLLIKQLIYEDTNHTRLLGCADGFPSVYRVSDIFRIPQGKNGAGDEMRQSRDKRRDLGDMHARIPLFVLHKLSILHISQQTT